MPKGKHTGKEGFTLIELSIVLVIIGLIIGGIFVGRDLIEAASLRATVSQIEKYHAAVHTFKTKYNALPGDIAASDAAAYGMLALNGGVPAEGDGDNNGLIEDGYVLLDSCTGGVNWNQFSGEIMLFWRHLTDTNLVDGQFGVSGNSAINATACELTNTVTAGNLTQSLPAPKIGHGLSITVMSGAGSNYFALFPITNLYQNGQVATNAAVGTNSGISPLEAYYLDTKMDDGMPETGTVLAARLAGPHNPGGFGTASQAERIGAQAPSASTVSASSTCVISSDGLGDLATDTYNLNKSSGGNDWSCSLAFRFQ